MVYSCGLGDDGGGVAALLPALLPLLLPALLGDEAPDA
jgi:hypothetical protein